MFKLRRAFLFYIMGIFLIGPSAWAADGAKAQKKTFHPVADAQVMNDEVGDVNSGDNETMAVLHGPDNHKQAYLKFEVNDIGHPIRKAILKVYVDKITKGDPSVPVDVWSADNDWEEHVITWNKRPAPKEKFTSFSSIPIFQQWMTADVSDYVKEEGVYTFCLGETEKADIVIPTREGKEGFRPLLEVYYGEGELDVEPASQAVETSTDVALHPTDDLSLDQTAANPESETLVLKGGASPSEAYLAFDLPQANGDVNSATLRLYCTNTPGENSKVSIYTTGNGWTEKSVSWESKPEAMPSEPLAEAALPGNEGWLEIDVQDYITGTGRYSFILRTDSESDVAIASSDATTNAPELAINHQDGLNKKGPQIAQAAKRIIARYSDQKLASMGILDVTKSPYNADNTGKTDATLAIQRALNEGRDSLCVTYLPSGTYLVSDTLEGISPNYKGPSMMMASNRVHYAPILKGPSDPAARPVIKLADNAPGFSDPENAKPIIHFWAVIGTPPNVYEKSNAHFSSQIMDINVDTNGKNGNAGAIGIDFLACERSTFQCVEINAEGSFAGIKHGLGSGGGMHDLTVIGGQYGAYLPVTQPTCSLSHATFKGQTVACVYNNSRGPLIMPGSVFEPAAGAKAVICKGGPGARSSAGLALIDARIEMAEGSTEPAILTDRSIYLNNVYMKNVGTLAVMKDAGEGYQQSGKADGWCHVKEYAGNAVVEYSEKQAVDGEVVRPDVIYVDGERRLEPLADIAMDGITAESIPADLQSRHTWKGLFPCFDTPGILNAWDYGVTPDGKSDQWAALQKAIDDASEKDLPLFLPKGVYPISKTLDLRKNTALVGAAQTATILTTFADPDANSESSFLDPKNPQPIIRTDDVADATTKIAFLRLTAEKSSYAYLWRAGAESTIRAIFAGSEADNGPVAIYRGNGGGRYYSAGLNDSLIDGTTQPLRFYHYQVQPHGAKIRNASNIDIFGQKYEGKSPVIDMSGCRNVRVFGEGGGGHPDAVYKVTDCTDFLIANIHPQFLGLPLGLRDMVLEDGKGTGDFNQVVLYKRGNPQPLK